MTICYFDSDTVTLSLWSTLFRELKNIVLTSILLIISKLLRLRYKFYLHENGKNNHFTWCWERFTGNFHLRLVSILIFFCLSAIMLFSTNHKPWNLTASAVCCKNSTDWSIFGCHGNQRNVLLNSYNNFSLISKLLKTVQFFTNFKYAEGMSFEYTTFVFYINSKWIHLSYRMMTVKRYSSTKSSL